MRASLAAAAAAAALAVVSASSAAPPARLPDAVIAERATAAILGGFLADAAAMPLHWIYDTNEIARLVGTGVPEFFNPPSCPFYNYQPGMNTPYGQQDMVYLRVGAAAGAFPPTAVEAAYYAQYKAGGPAAQGKWYFDESTKEFVANEEAGNTWPACGGNDNQADAIAHMVAVVALYAGNTSEMLAQVDTVIRVTQNTDDAAAFGNGAARILEYVLLYNMTGFDAVAAAAADMMSPTRAQPYPEDAALATGLLAMLAEVGESNMAVCAQVGSSCDYPHNLLTGAHLIAQLGAGPADYVNGTRQTILAGGDSGSRNVFVGAVQAARMGSASLLPAAWTGKTEVWPTILPLAAQLVAHRAPSAA
jgi:hypothetical protein